jgi:hypothetical protein
MAEGKEKYSVEASNRFSALEDSDAKVSINGYCILETIRQMIKISARESLGYYELNKYQQWLDDGCSKIIRSKKTCQDPSKINGDNLINGIKPASISGIKRRNI